MERKTTDELLQEIQNEKSFERFMSRNEENFETKKFTEYLNDLCRKKELIPEQVIKAAQIDRTYGHQLFNGTRRPSRDKVIQLAIAFELSMDDTQELLRVAGRNELYPRIRRDAAIIFGLSKHMEMQQMQEFLASLDISILGE
ncbi:MAG: helix-turn-helix transcriptional regulator [Roseburia sp.]|nr:helix-turn-helix transcriptional regulator [Roseburia sp.]